MRRSVLLCLCALAASVLATKPASACLPPPARSATEQAAHDREEQAGSWNEASTVYVARVAATGFLESATDALQSRPPAALQMEIVLTAERILKGQLDPDDRDLALIVPFSCVPSDIARARIGDHLVVYAGPEGPSSRSGMIALHRIQHPQALEAVRRTMGDVPSGTHWIPAQILDAD